MKTEKAQRIHDRITGIATNAAGAYDKAMAEIKSLRLEVKVNQEELGSHDNQIGDLQKSRREMQRELGWAFWAIVLAGTVNLALWVIQYARHGV